MDPQRRRARDHRQREGQFRLPADGADPPGQRPVLAMAPGHRAVAVRAGVRESSARPAGSRGPEHRPPAAAGRGRTARRPATAKSVLRQENVPHLFGIRGILEKQHHIMRSALPRIALLALIWDRVLVDHARRPRVLTGRGHFGPARAGRGGAVRHRSGTPGSSPAVGMAMGASRSRRCSPARSMLISPTLPAAEARVMHRSALDHYRPYCPVNAISPPVASPSEDDAAAATVHLA